VRRTAALVIALVVGGMAAPAAAKPLRVVLSSPLVDEGSDPNGCSPDVSGLGGPSVWKVRLERYLLDGKALVEESRQAKRNRFPLCIADRPVAKNAEVELSFVAHESGIARVAGIVLRFADPQDFYVVEADALAGSVRLVRVVDGQRRAIAGSAVSLATGQAHSLTIRAVDASFAATLDDQVLFKAQDAGIASVGRFGIWSRADSVTSFGDLFITPLD
jgi:hypothetical protein